MTGNLATVAAIYEAFGRGDVPFILDQLAENVGWESWENNYAQKAGVPAMVPRNGKSEVLEFFKVAGGMGIKDFQVLSLMEGENQVAAEIFIETSTYRDEEVHLWTFDDTGKVIRLRHYVDTAKHIAATTQAQPA